PGQGARAPLDVQPLTHMHRRPPGSPDPGRRPAAADIPAVARSLSRPQGSTEHGAASALTADAPSPKCGGPRPRAGPTPDVLFARILSPFHGFRSVALPLLL